MHPSVHLSILHPSIPPSIHPSIYSSIHPKRFNKRFYQPIKAHRQNASPHAAGGVEMFNASLHVLAGFKKNKQRTSMLPPVYRQKHGKGVSFPPTRGLSCRGEHMPGLLECTMEHAYRMFSFPETVVDIVALFSRAPRYDLGHR